MHHHNAHLVNHITKPELVNDSTLHVVGVISNVTRWHSRYRLAREWMQRMASYPNVKPYMVEVAFGDRHHELTVTDDASHLQLRTRSEIWTKEASINLGVRYLLPRDWRYVCWADCDIEFRHPGWALETIHQLQHFAVVQPWQNALDLGATGNVMQTFQSFGYLHQSRPNQPKQVRANDPYPYGHSGFAWACTRPLWEATRGLIDFAILGSGDHHMANGYVGDVAQTVHGGLGSSYLRQATEWQRRAMRLTHGQVGFTAGRLEHSFHGSKKARQYQTRWKILVDHRFDPEEDLMYDPQGLIQLTGKPDLEQAIRQYNRARDEDGTSEG